MNNHPLDFYNQLMMSFSFPLEEYYNRIMKPEIKIIEGEYEVINESKQLKGHRHE